MRQTRLLYVPVGRDALEILCERATRERRRPQDEAALILERALGVELPRSEPAKVPAPDAALAVSA